MRCSSTWGRGARSWVDSCRFRSGVWNEPVPDNRDGDRIRHRPCLRRLGLLVRYPDEPARGGRNGGRSRGGARRRHSVAGDSRRVRLLVGHSTQESSRNPSSRDPFVSPSSTTVDQRIPAAGRVSPSSAAGRRTWSTVDGPAWIPATCAASACGRTIHSPSAAAPSGHCAFATTLPAAADGSAGSQTAADRRSGPESGTAASGTVAATSEVPGTASCAAGRTLDSITTWRSIVQAFATSRRRFCLRERGSELDSGAYAPTSRRKPFSRNVPSAVNRRWYVSRSATRLPSAVAAATISMTTIW